MPKLLIIDDEPSIRLSIKAVFAREDIAVLGAETAEEGLRLTAEQSPEVILLDIKLGNRSGLDVFHELRQIDPTKPHHLHHGIRNHRHRHRSHETRRV